MGTRRPGINAAGRAVWAAVLALTLVVGLDASFDRHRSPRPPRESPFAWLRPEVPSRSWNVAATASHAVLAYPPGWRQIRTDPGTVSAAPAGSRGVFSGYLNATPRSGEETLANWSRFRVAHLAAEGARRVHLAAAATGLRFRSARGSCVIDSYSTPSNRFREIACIVTSARATTVVVAAAPTAQWSRRAALLEHAVASFAT